MVVSGAHFFWREVVKTGALFPSEVFVSAQAVGVQAAGVCSDRCTSEDTDDRYEFLDCWE